MILLAAPRRKRVHVLGEVGKELLLLMWSLESKLIKEYHRLRAHTDE